MLLQVEPNGTIDARLTAETIIRQWKTGGQADALFSRFWEELAGHCRQRRAFRAAECADLCRNAVIVFLIGAGMPVPDNQTRTRMLVESFGDAGQRAVEGQEEAARRVVVRTQSVKRLDPLDRHDRALRLLRSRRAGTS